MQVELVVGHPGVLVPRDDGGPVAVLGDDARKVLANGLFEEGRGGGTDRACLCEGAGVVLVACKERSRDGPRS